ncbi:MAG: sporulation protein YqfD, partial [Hydrogenoanaerobacterium sp.]
RYLRIFGADMPLFIYYPFKTAYDLQRKTDEIKIGKIELPFFLLTEQYDFYITKKRRLTTQQAHNEAQKKLTEKEKSIIGNGKIINTQQSESLNGDMYKLTTKYLCNIDIAKEQEILKNE